MNAYVLLAAASFAAVPASAQVSEQQILDCAVIVEAEQRLACFDRISAGLSAEAEAMIAERRAEEAQRARLAAEEARRQEEARAAAEAEERRMTAVEAFGHEQVVPGTGFEARELEEISSEVAEVIDRGGSRRIMILANGQIWQFEGPMRTLREGQPVTIKRAFGGSYIARAGARSDRVIRLR